MRLCKHFVFAAAVAAGLGLSQANYASAEEPATPTNNTATMHGDASPTGMGATATNVNADDAKAIRNTLAKLVEAGVTKNNFDDFTSYLSKADRDRLGDSVNMKDEKLDGRIAQFQKDWKDKYGQDFNLTDKEEVVFNNSQGIQIMQGQLSGDARTASEQMGPGMRDMNKMHQGMSQTGDPKTGANVDAAQNRTGTGNMERGGDIKSDATKTTPRTDDNGRLVDPNHGKDTANARQLGQRTDDAARVAADDAGTTAKNATVTARDNAAGTPRNVDTGDRATDAANRGMATVRVASGQGQAGNVNLINEGTVMNAWRVDLDNTIDGQRLHDNLLKHLTMVSEDKANWPADANEAYRAVSQHILAALTDTGAQPNNQPGMAH